MAMIRFDHVTFAYPGSYDNVFEDCSFQFDTSWKLGLIGRNGRGKTTLLRLLQHQYPYTGTITAEKYNPRCSLIIFRIRLRIKAG